MKRSGACEKHKKITKVAELCYFLIKIVFQPLLDIDLCTNLKFSVSFSYKF